MPMACPFGHLLTSHLDHRHLRLPIRRLHFTCRFQPARCRRTDVGCPPSILVKTVAEGRGFEALIPPSHPPPPPQRTRARHRLMPMACPFGHLLTSHLDHGHLRLPIRRLHFTCRFQPARCRRTDVGCPPSILVKTVAEGRGFEALIPPSHPPPPPQRTRARHRLMPMACPFGHLLTSHLDHGHVAVHIGRNVRRRLHHAFAARRMLPRRSAGTEAQNMRRVHDGLERLLGRCQTDSSHRLRNRIRAHGKRSPIHCPTPRFRETHFHNMA